MPASADIDEMVQDILADIPIKEKAAIANLNEDKVPYTFSMLLMSAFVASLERMTK